MQSIQLAHLDVDALRTRLRKMSDEELREFGKAARYMVSPTANMGKPPLPAFVLQLEEARAEWRRRHWSSGGRIHGMKFESRVRSVSGCHPVLRFSREINWTILEPCLLEDGR